MHKITGDQWEAYSLTELHRQEFEAYCQATTATYMMIGLAVVLAFLIVRRKLRKKLN